MQRRRACGPDSAVGRTQPAWFSLGRWGKLVNILALVYGGLMIINIALWAEPVAVR